MRFAIITRYSTNRADNMRVLMIEDDFTTIRAVKIILKYEAVDVLAVGLGEEGIALARIHDYDIILLDLSLPDMTGFSVLNRLRSISIHTPVIVLSGDGLVESKVRALRAGADDYVTKPFNKAELVARIHAVLNRASEQSDFLITTGKITVNLDAKTALACGSKIPLTNKEYETLEALSLRKGATLTKAALMNRLYGGGREPGAKIIDIFICKLRKKLFTATSGDDYIKTVWGGGYMLSEPAELKPQVTRSGIA